MSDAFVKRQAILNQKGKTVAYQIVLSDFDAEDVLAQEESDHPFNLHDLNHDKLTFLELAYYEKHHELLNDFEAKKVFIRISANDFSNEDKRELIIDIKQKGFNIFII